ncbi:MAG: hypothetical protein JNM06_12840 [Blastocatellia bacterium]|nr:hypothetical protein [Blastocatellia bacterium]
MPVVRKMEVIIKISEFPEDVKTVTNNWKEFVVEADNKQITITARPKMFNKIKAMVVSCQLVALKVKSVHSGGICFLCLKEKV